VARGSSEPTRVTSRFELGVDTIDGREVYPEKSEDGRIIQESSEFELALLPENLGVLLRRTLDYAYPDQRAEVLVAPVGHDFKVGPFQSAGIWYLAGSNTCVYSNPKDELGATQHVVQTANRRLRDDEFIIPRAMTRGQHRIRVRIRVTPVGRPLFPGRAVAEQGWSELAYRAGCWIRPAWTR
jgi:hypothetical protein